MMRLFTALCWTTTLFVTSVAYSEQPPPLTKVSTAKTLVMGTATVSVLELRQFYTEWFFEEQKNRYVAFYFFKPNPASAQYKKQALIYYPDGEDKHFTYYYNLEKEKFWGRCCTKDHPQFDPEEMVWSFPKGEGWGELTKGNPAIPGSTDKKQMSMSSSPPDPRQKNRGSSKLKSGGNLNAVRIKATSDMSFSLRQFYTGWWHEQRIDRYMCLYFFKPNPALNEYQKQIVIYYPKSKKYSPQHTYFFNIEKRKYWGRCCTKAHPQFNPNEMVWSFPKGVGWGELTTGSPSIPGSTDRQAMDSPPLTPPPPPAD